MTAYTRKMWPRCSCEDLNVNLFHHRAAFRQPIPGKTATCKTVTLTQNEKERCHTQDACHWGPERIFHSCVTEAAQILVTKATLAAKAKRKRLCGFQPTEKQRWLAKSHSGCIKQVLVDHSYLGAKKWSLRLSRLIQIRIRAFIQPEWIWMDQFGN